MVVELQMNNSVIQPVRTCYYLHILTFVKVVLVHCDVNYVTFSTILIKSKKKSLNSFRT